MIKFIFAHSNRGVFTPLKITLWRDTNDRVYKSYYACKQITFQHAFNCFNMLSNVLYIRESPYRINKKYVLFIEFKIYLKKIK